MNKVSNIFGLIFLSISLATPVLSETVNPSTATPPNALTRTAVQAGILTCAARIQQVTQFVGFDAKAAGMLMKPGSRPDQEMISMQVGLNAGAEGNSLVDLTFAPKQEDGCAATYQAISYWAFNCKSVAELQFAAFKSQGALLPGLNVLDGGNTTKVFLLKAGEKGCISIKKEVVN